eukprot:TRINITY_DN10211_c0_g1_i1.p1 TRINITY_DN10211_c0_g1~~TRINITY_DN10211_c0_g1_i1.p1  ORF type:complete len:2211 (-),score=726.26 TRINITY_DN10211_c0_g1_i1:224-6673(-)
MAYLPFLSVVLFAAAAHGATITWNTATAAGTAWATATAWVGNVIPGTSDDVIIPSGSNTITVAASITISSLTVNSGSAITFNSGVTATMTNMTLALNGNIIVFNGVLLSVTTLRIQSTSGVTLSLGTGAMALVNNLYLSNAGHTINLASNPTLARLNVSNVFDWSTTGLVSTLGDLGSAATGQLNLLSTCTGSISGTTGALRLYAQFNNFGTMTYNCPSTGSGLQTFTGSFRNYGNFTVTGSANQVMIQSTAQPFINYGNMTIDVTSDFRMTNSLEQRGTVYVARGRFRLASGGVSYNGSTISHAPGSFVQFEAGLFTHQLGATIANGDGIVFLGGIIALAGAFLPTSFQYTGPANINFTQPAPTQLSFPEIIQNYAGTIVFATGLPARIGTYTLTGGSSSVLMIVGCTLVIDTLLMNSNSGTVRLDSIPSGAVLNITSRFEWTANAATLNDANNMGLAIVNLLPTCTTLISVTGSNNVFLYNSLRNYGTVLYQCTGSYGLRTYYGGTIINYGQFVVSNTVSSIITMSYSPGNFQNYGTLLVNMSSGDMTFGLPLEQRGVLNVVGGKLILTGGGTFFDTSMTTHSGSGQIQFQTSSYTVAAGATISNGTGIIFQSGTFTNNGLFWPDVFTINGGTVNFFTTGVTYYWTSVTQNGGAFTLQGADVRAMVGTYAMPGSSASLTLQVAVQMVVKTFMFTGSSGNVYLSSNPSAILNITDYLEWTGSSNNFNDANQVTATLGVVNLMPGSRSLVSHAGGYLYNIMNNYGNMTYSCTANGIRTYGSVTFRNYGVMTVQDVLNGGFLYYSGSGTFVNYGLMVVNVTIDFRINNLFDQRGTLNVVNGVMRVQAGGTAYLGSFSGTSGGGTLQYEASYTALEGSTVTSNSNVIFQYGTFTATGTFLASSFLLTGGSVMFNQPNGVYYFASVVQNNGGTVTFSGPFVRAVVDTYTQLGSSATLTLAGGAQLTVGTMMFVGSGNTININSGTPDSMMTVTTYFEWGGVTSANRLGDSGSSTGTCQFTIGPNATAYLWGIGGYTYPRFNNYGRLTYAQTPNGLRTYTPGQIRNYGFWNVTEVPTPGVILYNSNAAFVNYGVISIDISDTFHITNLFENYGVLSLVRGGIRIKGGGNAYANSLMTSANGSYIQLESGFTQQAGAMWDNGGGRVLFAAGTTNLNGNFLPTSFEFFAGSVYFSNPQQASTYAFDTIYHNAAGTIAFVPNLGLVTVRMYYMQNNSATLRIGAGASMTIGSMYMSGTNNKMEIYSTAPMVSQFNITKYFEWSNSGNNLQDSSGVGVFNLMPTCTSDFSGPGGLSYIQLNNYGTMTYSMSGQGYRTSASNTHVKNFGNWTISSSSSAAMVQYSYTNSFFNYGNMTVNVIGDMLMDNAFQNYGMLRVTAGVMRIRNGNCYTGSMNQSTDGIYQFETGTFTVAAPCIIGPGNGMRIVLSGILDVYGLFLASALELTSGAGTAGTVNFRRNDATYYFPSISHTMGGTVSFLGTGCLLLVDSYSITGTTTCTLSLNAGIQATFGSFVMTTTLTSTLNVWGTAPPTRLNITNYFEWSGPSYIVDPNNNNLGYVTIMPDATGSIYNAAPVVGVVFQNYGSLTVNVPSGIKLAVCCSYSNAIFNNYGSLDWSGVTSGFTNYYTSSTFNNYGYLKVNLQTTWQFSSGIFNNYGIIDIRRGIFDLAATTLRFYNGTDLMAWSSVTIKLGGPSTMTTVNPGALIRPGSGLQLYGTINYLADLTQTAVYQSSGTTITLSGGGTVGMYTQVGGSLSIASTGPKTTMGLTILGTSSSLTTTSECAFTTLTASSPATLTYNMATNVTNTIDTLVLNPSVTLTLNSKTLLQINNANLGTSNSFALASTAELRIARSFQWTSTTGGAISGGGIVTLLPGSRTVISGGGTGLLVNAIFNNYGTIQYQPTGANGFQLQTGSGVFRNQPGGVFNVSGTANTFFTPATNPNTFWFHNLGTFLVSLPASVEFTINTALNNTGIIRLISGIMKPYNLMMRDGVLTMGFGTRLIVGGGVGATTNAQSLGLAAGVVEGTGDILGIVLHTGGTLRPGVPNFSGSGAVGTLSIGTLNQTSVASYVEIAFSNSTLTSRLNVTSTAMLAGTLLIVPGCPYFPQNGDAFPAVVSVTLSHLCMHTHACTHIFCPPR